LAFAARTRIPEKMLTTHTERGAFQKTARRDRKNKKRPTTKREGGSTKLTRPTPGRIRAPKTGHKKKDSTM